MSALTELMRIAVAAYLLAVAASALLGLQQNLLFFPFKAIWSALRIFLLIISLGKIRLVPVARRARRRGSRGFRGLKFRINEWRDERSENKALARGETLGQISRWETKQ